MAEHLATEAGLEYSGESLPVVYAASRRPLGARLSRLLEAAFKHTRPSAAYEALARYPWARVYTLNIDDAFESALRRNSKQHVNVRYRFDRIADRSPFFDEVDVVKLNGSVDRLAEGLIFSPQEYGAASADVPLWYEELARDFFRYTFLFVGTKLAEPLFYHQVERFRATVGSVEGESYVLTPSATVIEAGGLQELNLVHVPGTLEQFAAWLKSEIPEPPLPVDVAKRVFPQLEYLAKSSTPEQVLRLFESVVRVGRVELASHLQGKISRHKVRDFYRGFKPTWRDILDGVPAELRGAKKAMKRLLDVKSGERLFVIYGPAGSGKSTALMQTALWLSEKSRFPVYHLSEPIRDVRELLSALEESSKTPYFLCVDRLSLIAESLDDALRTGRYSNLIVVATERQNIWLSRTKEIFGGLVADSFALELIDSREAKAILGKLELFGPWSRLSKLTPTQRQEEILAKAHRQLLIGLLEATAGRGFDKIIEKDYHDLADGESRKFVLLVGLATVHRLGMPEAIVSRALAHMRISVSVSALLERTSGIVRRSGETLVARHPVYVERLFELVIEKREKWDAIHALLSAFTVYSRPLMKSVGKNAGSILKLTLNHRFLKNILQGDIGLTLEIFESFAKAFQDDALFWLHFGLALRDAGLNDDALDKLRIARDSHRLRQADHAYAQQLLIIADDAPNTLAMAYLHEAKGILEALDAQAAGADSEETDYPIVTLSEHHTKVVARIEGLARGREIAKYYANILGSRAKASPDNQRLKRAWKSLIGFATTGAWD
ncbi:SIR2 family protein [Rubrivivax sp. JA1024]|nr:SIR2 family protein [Rubrivivax sp. JA1024]